MIILKKNAVLWIYSLENMKAKYSTFYIVFTLAKKSKRKRE